MMSPCAEPKEYRLDHELGEKNKRTRQIFLLALFFFSPWFRLTRYHRVTNLKLLFERN